MFNPAKLVTKNVKDILRKNYAETFGGLNPENADVICWATDMALENIANTTALYHNLEHTVMVTLAGQELFKGRHLRQSGSRPEDWLHFTLSCLCHDIGFVHGVCQEDTKQFCFTKPGEELLERPRGASDAILHPYHVDRSKQFIKERFAPVKMIDEAVVTENIEYTRFPSKEIIQKDEEKVFPKLLRAADLIGQLGDPTYLLKTTALYYEFEENGVNKIVGYTSPGNLIDEFPKFFWEAVYPHIQEELYFLSYTQEGRQWIANLYCNVFNASEDKSVYYKKLEG